VSVPFNSLKRLESEFYKVKQAAVMCRLEDVKVKAELDYRYPKMVEKE
jgi:hypothetical protein